MQLRHASFAVMLGTALSLAACSGNQSSQDSKGGAPSLASAGSAGLPSASSGAGGVSGSSGNAGGEVGTGAVTGGSLGTSGESSAPAGSANLAGASGSGGGGALGDERTLDRETYRDRLIGLWLAESVANWTGLLTEGQFAERPFLTDDDWGTKQGRTNVAGSAQGTIDFNFLSPWGSDDDTDIEFIYVTKLAELGKLTLSPTDIQEAWNQHTEPSRYVWVSNLAAQKLMRSSPAVLPPSTSLYAANDQSLMIDAQLTTEIFGALAPGLPEKALEIADLPITTTASGFAAHAAQFFVALYSLAPLSDPALTDRERILWLVRGARRLLPEESKSSAVIDFVLSDYLENPDVDDWERTRDRVAERFQEGAAENGYRYLQWYESSVNLASGLIALLYGEGDLKRTIQIGTLSGWDSDNGTATVGGLLGLLFGTEYVRDAFPERELSMDYDIGRTRVGFSPSTLSMEQIAARMLPLVERAIRESGGEVDADGSYRLPPLTIETLSPQANPRFREHLASVNNASGAAPVASIDGGSKISDSAEPAALVDGLEVDGSGRDRRLRPSDARCVGRTGEGPVTLTVTWSQAFTLTGALLVEGGGDAQGGWLEAPSLEARVDGTWVPVSISEGYAPNPELTYQEHRFTFTKALEADGLRLRGTPGGGYATFCELDGIRSSS